MRIERESMNGRIAARDVHEDQMTRVGFGPGTWDLLDVRRRFGEAIGNTRTARRYLEHPRGGAVGRARRPEGDLGAVGAPKRKKGAGARRCDAGAGAALEIDHRDT